MAANQPVNPDAPKRIPLKRGNSHFDLEYQQGLNPEKIRAQFISKVYGILSAQLLYTFAICAAFVFVEPVHKFGLSVVGSMAWTWGMGIGGMITICAMMAKKDEHPTNMWLLLLFTTFFSLMIGPLCGAFMAAGKGYALLAAAGTTFLIFFTLSAYVWYSDTDFSFMGGFLVCALIANIVMGFIAWMAGWAFMTTLYHIFGVLIFSGFILYDTDQIVNKVQLEDCDQGTAIWGATELYLDIINLFIHLLALFGDR